MRFRVSLFLCWLLSSAFVVAAEAVCYQYRMATDPWNDSLEGAISYRVGLCNSDSTQCGQSNSSQFSNWVFSQAPGVSVNPTTGEPQATTVYIVFQRTTNGTHPAGAGIVDGPYNLGTGVNFQVNPAGCPCEATVGEEITGTGTGSLPTGTVCKDGCSYTVGGVGLSMSGVWASQLVGTGSSCTTSDVAGGNCIIKGGVQSCVTKSAGENCGTYNGDEICVDVLEPGQCQTYASGGMACVSDASTPPAPDSGISGAPATPSLVVSGSGGQTVNYYNSTVVNNSESAATGSGGGTAGPTSTGADGSSSSSASSDACLPGTECAGDLPAIGASGDLTFSQAVSGFYSRVQNAPLVASVSGVGAAFPSGSCPIWTLEAFGEDFSLSAPMCSIWEDISSFLSGVMLLVWGWVATRIVLSA